MPNLAQKPEIEFTFDPEKHLYAVKGEVWPSNTQLLKEFGLLDFSNVPPERLEYKRILGTRVHKACEILANCQALDEDQIRESMPEIIPYVNAYRKFREIHDFEPNFIEHRMVSRKWRFGTTLDQQGPFNGVETMLEIKCSWEIYKANGPQTAGQEIAFTENTGIKIKRRVVLQLKENGSFELHECEDRADFNDFLACIVLHWRKRNVYKTGEIYDDHAA